MSVKVAKTLDVRGMYCPGPVMEVVKVMKTINMGDVLEVLATDPRQSPTLKLGPGGQATRCLRRFRRTGT